MRRIVTIDPSFVRDAVLKGLTLVVDVGDRHCKVTVGPPSRHQKLTEEINDAVR